MADKMPFVIQKMLSFAADRRFKIETSSPRYHRSNGTVERYVQTMKLFINASLQVKMCTGHSWPFEKQQSVAVHTAQQTMLFNRVIRSGLPVTTATLRPAIVDPWPQWVQRKQSQKGWYDIGTKYLDDLEPGSRAWVHTGDDASWSKGVVVENYHTPWSYLVDKGQSIVGHNSLSGPLTVIAVWQKIYLRVVSG